MQRSSQHFKGWVLDTVIAELTQGKPFRHVVGYELHETRRAVRDARYNTALRTGEYPLRQWGWSRADAQAFLRTTFGLDRDWAKSACTYCPFALTNKTGRSETVARFIAEPDAGVLALAMEFSATCLNPAQGLIKGERLLTLLRTSAGTAAVLTAFEELLASMPWAIYDVRRTLSPRVDGKTNHARSIRMLDVGGPAEMRVELNRRADLAGTAVTIGDPAFPDDAHPRIWLRTRDPKQLVRGLATAEQFLTIAPATAADKTGPAFPAAWAAASQLILTS
ncbi:hypothetical protein [Nocardia sp. NRRL S-836]|uniref:hypothetical protein n=1 Tax=Nocardia sp. NRRL S-836 TaxID=1519492 RepID=UPI0006AF8251|nr:hypothetical protein [Nocardia sp. NRRL S-836]